MKRFRLDRRFLVIVLTFAVAVVAAVVPSASGRAAKVDKTLHVSLGYQLLSLDPAVAYDTQDWQVLYATCVKLFNYPDSAAPAGSVPVPEAAASWPTVSSDGLVYTFTVPYRDKPVKGKRFQFSPPSNELVSAASFQTAFNRLRALDPVSGLYSILYSDVVSVVASGTQLTVTLSHPNPNIIARLAMPAMCAVPVATPATESQTIPSAGPYYVASADRTGVTVLRVNPNYRGSRLGKSFNEIDISANQAFSSISDGLSAGTVDYGPGLSGPDSWWRSFQAAHPNQLQINPEPVIQFLWLNSLRLPLAIRRAVNYAINRVALSQFAQIFSQSPADHIIPPGMPGSVPGSYYPATGDPTTAATLAAGYTTPVEIYSTPSAYRVAMANSVATSLRAIGLTVHLNQISATQYYPFLQNPASHWDIAFGGWAANFLDPSDFMDNLVQSSASSNLGHFSGYDAAIASADAVPLGPNRNSAFAQLDNNLTLNAAPMAVISNYNSRDPFSARIGCQTYSPAFGIDLAALCQ
jgi:ABC-type transport system substrate-binding protein